jgi:hypothetical protein
MEPMITSEDDLRSANNEVRCSACDAVLWNQEGARTPQFIQQILGVSRPVGEITTPDGGLLEVTEHPSICASPACLEKVMSDPKWHHKSVEAWATERERILKESPMFAPLPPRSSEEEERDRESQRKLDYLIERERVVRKTLYRLGKDGPVHRETSMTYIAAICEAVKELASIEDGLVELMGAESPVVCRHQL